MVAMSIALVLGCAAFLSFLMYLRDNKGNRFEKLEEITKPVRKSRIFARQGSISEFETKLVAEKWRKQTPQPDRESGPKFRSWLEMMKPGVITRRAVEEPGKYLPSNMVFVGLLYLLLDAIDSFSPVHSQIVIAMFVAWSCAYLLYMLAEILLPYLEPEKASKYRLEIIRIWIKLDAYLFYTMILLAYGYLIFLPFVVALVETDLDLNP